MKNYILNKKLFSWLPTGVLFLLFTILFMTLFVSGVVWAQSEFITDTSEHSTEPAPRSEVTSSSFSVNIYRPYLVKIVDEGSEIITSTPYRDPSNILWSAGLVVYPEDEFTFERNNNLVGEPLVGFMLLVDRATPVKFNLRGASTVTVRTQSETVADLISERGVVLGINDTVEPALNSKLTPGLEVSVYRVGKQTITVEEDLNFKREFIDDANLAYGSESIKTPGVVGKTRVTYEITYYDNVEVSRTLVRSITLKESIKEVVIRGTKGAPASKGSLTTAQIQFLGGCEAGMNPTRNSSNGYYGAFQFSIGTWNAMGTGYARADLAPLDVQIAAVQKLLTGSSIFGQFPGCANKMVAAGLL